MARPLRIQAAGLIYHVTSRGNAQIAIYADDEDREWFVRWLGRISAKHGVQIYAYCEMTNHYHLICRTERPNVSRAMRDLNGGYAQYFNRRHGRSGHLFQGRFNGQVVEEEGYLREACRYVALNPVRAGLVSSPELWPWSAHRALAGIDPESPFLSSDFLRREFLEQDLRVARARYVEFVQAAMDLPRAPAEAPFESDARVVGSGEFIACFEERLMSASREVPRRERFLARPSLDAVLAGTPAWAQLNQRMLKAHEQYGYTLADIATFIGISHARVSARLSEARSRLSVQQT